MATKPKKRLQRNANNGVMSARLNMYLLLLFEPLPLSEKRNILGGLFGLTFSCTSKTNWNLGQETEYLFTLLTGHIYFVEYVSKYHEKGITDRKMFHKLDLQQRCSNGQSIVLLSRSLDRKSMRDNSSHRFCFNRQVNITKWTLNHFLST